LREKEARDYFLPVHLPTQAVRVEDSFAKQLTEAGIIKSTLFKRMNLLATNTKIYTS